MIAIVARFRERPAIAPHVTRARMLRPPKRVPWYRTLWGACGCEVRADARQNELQIRPSSSSTRCQATPAPLVACYKPNDADDNGHPRESADASEKREAIRRPELRGVRGMQGVRTIESDRPLRPQRVP